MPVPNLSDIEENAKPIVQAIGREAVEVYRFLSCELNRDCQVTENYLFQFIFRSFYRLDNAGLGPALKAKYFSLLEGAHKTQDINLRQFVTELYNIPTLKGQNSLQFSFVTKLASTVNHKYPIYDSEVASVFGFRAPYSYKTFDVRLNEYLTFYEKLCNIYTKIIDRNLLQEPRRIFKNMYEGDSNSIPDMKVLDFIFWSAGKLSFEAEQV